MDNPPWIKTKTISKQRLNTQAPSSAIYNLLGRATENKERKIQNNKSISCFVFSNLLAARWSVLASAVPAWLVGA